MQRRKVKKAVVRTRLARAAARQTHRMRAQAAETSHQHQARTLGTRMIAATIHAKMTRQTLIVKAVAKEHPST